MDTQSEHLDGLRPQPATAPEQACQLIAGALGDGDLLAASSYYEPNAVLAEPGRPPLVGRDRIERRLAALIAARLAVDLRIRRVLASGPLALVNAAWTASGTDPDGLPIHRHGTARTIVHRTDDGWRIAVEELDEEE